jgi:DNA-binding NarL/FixJ family response regulator
LSGSATLILLVDDFAPWRNYVSSTLQKHPRFRIIDEASDGIEAVQKARVLKPDLILMDVGLPILNGIEAARQIRQIVPASKILFLSENRSPDIAEEALNTGAAGYVVKADAARQLLPAIEAVLQGKTFVSARLAAKYRPDSEHNPAYAGKVIEPAPAKREIPVRHSVGFYYDDQRLIDDGTQFIGSALKAGNAAIVIATAAHRDNFLSRLHASGLDIRTAIEEGRYIALDAASTLLTFMHNGTLDSAQCMKLFGQLILTAANAAKGSHPRVAVFGEGVGLLCSDGNVEAAIQIERLANQLTKAYDVEIWCAYFLDIQHPIDSHVLEKIRAEHSALYSR